VTDTTRIERCAAYGPSALARLQQEKDRAVQAEEQKPKNATIFQVIAQLIVFVYSAIIVGVFMFAVHLLSYVPWWAWVILLIIILPSLPIRGFMAILALPLKTVRHYVTGMQAWDEFKARLRYAWGRLRGRPVIPEKTGGELGSAGFCSSGKARQLMDENGRTPKGAAVLLGHVGGAPFAWFTEKHVLILASSRSGKGVSLIIPNLLAWSGGVFVLDPKGENARATVRRRSSFGKVAVIDPWGVSGLPATGFNPLARVCTAGDSMVTEATALAGALVVGEENHWNHSAIALLRGLILHVVTSPEFEGKRDLVRVRWLLMALAPNDLAEKLMENTAAGGLVQQCGLSFLHTPESERGSILSTARQQTMVLDDPRLQDSSRGWTRRGARCSFTLMNLPRSGGSKPLSTPWAWRPGMACRFGRSFRIRPRFATTTRLWLRRSGTTRACGQHSVSRTRKRRKRCLRHSG
jgi:hypothetical protein